MRNLLPATRTVLALAAVVAVVVGTGVATGAIPGADGTITACSKVKGGAVRVIDAESGGTCASDELRLSWNQKGPVGPAGPQGEPGLQGAADCDASRLLLCPDADLPSGQTLHLTIDGVDILQVSRYRINCTTNNGSPTCELVLTGTALRTLDADRWYDSAALDQPTATKNFSLTVRGASGEAIYGFAVTRGRP